MTKLTPRRSATILDKEHGTTVWVLTDDGWKAFRGPRFDVWLLVCEGRPEDIPEQVLQLRLTCPQGPADGWRTFLEWRQLREDAGALTVREDGTVLFGFRWCVTDGPYPYDNHDEEPHYSQSTQPPLSIRDVLKEDLEVLLAKARNP